MKGLYINDQEKGKQYVKKVEHHRKNDLIYYFESAFADIGGSSRAENHVTYFSASAFAYVGWMRLTPLYLVCRSTRYNGPWGTSTILVQADATSRLSQPKPGKDLAPSRGGTWGEQWRKSKSCGESTYRLLNAVIERSLSR